MPNHDDSDRRLISHGSTTRRRRTLIVSLVVIVIAAIGAIAWWGYERYETRARGLDIEIDPARYPVRGIDLSHHNGHVDFNAVRDAGISFVYLKATDGVGDVDPLFADNFARAKAAGLKVGVYHFFRTHRGGRQQAEVLLETVRDLDVDLPLAIDLEKDSHTRGHREDVVPRIRTMIARLRDEGRRVILYANYDQFADFLDGNFRGEDLWLATSREPSNPYDPRTIWQYSHHGHVPGITGDVDMNAFVGSRDDFDRWSGGDDR